MTLDTTFIGNGETGPYQLHGTFIDSQSIRISSQDSSVKPPSWTFNIYNNSLYFVTPVDTSEKYVVSYETRPLGIQQQFSLYKKNYYTPDTSKDTSQTNFLYQYGKKDDLQIQGYKSVRLAIGSLGEVNVEQGLDMRIGGAIRSGTSIEAHLSDQATTLDGATREISEFDMIYLTLTDKKFKVTAGDQYKEWFDGGIFKYTKKLKGLSVSSYLGPSVLDGYIALSGGQHTTEYHQGRLGVQGPYNLRGDNSGGFVNVAGGTVSIWKNGEKLKEGLSEDFTVDYELGTVTFTPNSPIFDRDIIRIEYEYRTYDYQRVFSGVGATVSNFDSTIVMKGAFWNEQDNANNPLDVNFTEDEKTVLRTSGDNLPFGNTARLVQSQDVDSVDALYPLYKIRKDSTGNEYFQFTRYNPLHPDSTQGFYTVWFAPLSDISGDYEPIDSSLHREIVYKYVGKGKGRYSAKTRLIAPVRNSHGEVLTSVKLSNLSLSLDVAGVNNDKNLYSNRDDSDNSSSAVELSLLAGQRNLKKRSIWFTASSKYISKNFLLQKLDNYTQYNKWNDTTALGGKQQIDWESSLGITPIDKLNFSFLVGQRRIDSKNQITKYSPSFQTSTADILGIRYNGNFFRHHQKNGTSQRQNLYFDFKPENPLFSLGFYDEWFTDSSGNGKGLGGIEGLLTIEKLKITQKSSYERFYNGHETILSGQDTGYSFHWSQNMSRDIFPWWNCKIMSSYTKTKNRPSDERTIIVGSLHNQITSSKGFSLQHTYQLNSEMALKQIQIPKFVGRGLGTHRYDSTLQEYVPHVPGDFTIVYEDVYDENSDSRIRSMKSDVYWSFTPVDTFVGILNDLSWNGTLLIEERVDAFVKGVSSYLPGHSIFENSRENLNSKGVSFADISYRQDIEWARRGAPTNTHVNLFFLPSLRFVPSYLENAFETGFTWNYTKSKWENVVGIRWLGLRHQDTIYENYHVRDWSIDIMTKRALPENFKIGFNPRYGKSSKGDLDKIKPYSQLNKNYYVSFKPFLEWQHDEKGRAVLSYIYNIVNTEQNALDYRMANGFSPGLTHSLQFLSDISISKKISLFVSYRGDFHRPQNESKFDKPLHTLSVEGKALF